MLTISRYALAALLSVSPLAGAAEGVTLKLEKTTTLRVGQTATLQLPTLRPYVVSSAGDALVKLEPVRAKAGVICRYRAAHPGNETLLVVPSDLPKSHSVSAATRHYFVTVVP
jgi:hypothetical protein